MHLYGSEDKTVFKHNMLVKIMRKLQLSGKASRIKDAKKTDY